MTISSPKTILEVTAAIFVNLTSAWLGILLVSPGLANATSQQYINLLLHNLPFAIVGLLLSFWLTERSKTV